MKFLNVVLISSAIAACSVSTVLATEPFKCDTANRVQKKDATGQDVVANVLAECGICKEGFKGETGSDCIFDCEKANRQAGSLPGITVNSCGPCLVSTATTKYTNVKGKPCTATTVAPPQEPTEEEKKKAEDAAKKLVDDEAARKLAEEAADKAKKLAEEAADKAKKDAEEARVKAGQAVCDLKGKNRKFDVTLVPAPAESCPCATYHTFDADKKDCVMKDVATYDATECVDVHRKFDANAAKKCGDCIDGYASEDPAPNKMCFPKMTVCSKKGRKLEGHLCKCQKGMKPKVDLDYGTDVDCESNAMRAVVSTSAVVAALGAFLYLL